MKKIRRENTMVLIFLLGLFQGCGTPQDGISGNYSFKTECLGVEGDGSQTVKSWGKGRNRRDAIEQAKKNAIRDVLFKGISNGSEECNRKPLLFEVNIQEKKEDYFNNFFKDDGPYKEFISDKDGSDLHLRNIAERKKSGDQEMYGIVVRVERSKLKRRMTIDKIIKRN